MEPYREDEYYDYDPNMTRQGFVVPYWFWWWLFPPFPPRPPFAPGPGPRPPFPPGPGPRPPRPMPRNDEDTVI